MRTVRFVAKDASFDLTLDIDSFNMRIVLKRKKFIKNIPIANSMIYYRQFEISFSEINQSTWKNVINYLRNKKFDFYPFYDSDTTEKYTCILINNISGQLIRFQNGETISEGSLTILETG